jgi:hypothetical protein
LYRGLFGTTLVGLVLLAAFVSPATAQEAPICLSAKHKLSDKAETWKGKQTRDSVTGLRGADKLYGRGGNDFINGSRDNDEVNGGAGDDILCGGRGNDRLIGGAGNDLIYGEEENDWVDGGTGIDRILGSAEADDLYGGPDDDVVAGGGGLANDRLDGGTEIDLCIAGEDDTLAGCEQVADDPQGADSDEPANVGAGEQGEETETSIQLTPFGASGRVTSPDPACVGDRYVRLNTYEYGYISVRLDTTRSDGAGDWSINYPLLPGLYFAQVDSAPGCRYAVSETLPL